MRLAVHVGLAVAIAAAWAITVSAGQEGGGGRPATIAGCPSKSSEFYPCAKPKAAAFIPPRNPDGTPNMNDYFKIVIGKDIPAQFKSDLQLELDAVKRLNDFVEQARLLGDNGSRDLFQHILEDEEEHIDWLEAQLGMISEIGLPNYLAQQIYDQGKE